MTVSVAARKAHLSTAALLAAVRKGEKIKACKIKNRWMLTQGELEGYLSKKYDRRYTKIDGEPLFEIEKGTYDIRSASEIFEVPAQALYYAIRTRRLKYIRKKCSYVLEHRDILNFLKQFRGQ